MAVSIVCYSNTGNNQVLADHLAERLQCGIAPIVERRRRTWLRTLLDLAFGWSPPIEPLHSALSAYQHVILVGPVWASRLASPLRTFLAEHRQELGDYSFITLCGYSRSEQKQRLTEELTRRVGHAPRAVCELPVAALLPRTQRNDIRVVTPYRIHERDLRAYENRIASFLTEADVPPRGQRFAPAMDEPNRTAAVPAGDASPTHTRPSSPAPRAPAATSPEPRTGSSRAKQPGQL